MKQRRYRRLRVVSRRSRRSGQLAEVHDISKARLVQGLRNLHVPYGIYTECGHEHTDRDEFALYIEGVGWTCDVGLVEVICQHCCVGEHAQAAVCTDQHEHKPDRAVCPTMALVEGLEPPWETG